MCVAVAALAGAADTKKAANGDPAKGKAVFEAQACNTCHSLGTDKIMGPGLKGLFARPKMQNGKKPTEATVGAVIDAGGNGMPPYKEMLKPSERRDLIAYLKTL
jgi:mono/diheme cytochrome c family protein